MPPTFTELSNQITAQYRSSPMMRVVNYHNTPRSKADQLERELAQYSKDFSSVNETELRDYLRTGRWTKSKPGMIPVLYEGYRNGYDVMAPLLEKYNFVGWYFIITEFIKSSIPDQLPYALSHHINMLTREYPDGRYALTWDEIKKLSQKHVIASHARNHSELSTLTEDVREREIFGSQEDFKKYLGRPVLGFSSLRGPAHQEHPEVDTSKLVEAAGYEFIFSNYRIERIGIGGQHGRT